MLDSHVQLTIVRVINSLKTIPCRMCNTDLEGRNTAAGQLTVDRSSNRSRGTRPHQYIDHHMSLFQLSLVLSGSTGSHLR